MVLNGTILKNTVFSRLYLPALGDDFGGREK